MSQAADFPLDRTSTPPTRGPGVVAVVIAAVFGALLWLTVAFQALFIVPRFERIFLDFKMKLPLVTEWVLHYPLWSGPVCFLAVLLLCIPRRSRWVGIALLVIIPLIVNLLFIAGLYFPYVELVNGLEGVNQ